MATITSKEIIVKILNNDGAYPGDPQCYSVFEYTNQFGNQSWAIFPSEYNDIYDIPHVINPILLFRKDLGLTKEGEKYLEYNE